MLEKEKIIEGLEMMSAGEREAVRTAAATAWNISSPAERDAMVAALGGLVMAKRRATRRRESDSATDHQRRTLIGARVPWALAAQCKRAAAAQGVSLYRWVVDTIEQACYHQAGGEPDKR